MDLGLYKDVWVFAEQRDNKLMNVVFELLGEATKLAKIRNSKVCAILCGHNANDLVNELYEYGADVVYYADDERLGTCDSIFSCHVTICCHDSSSYACSKLCRQSS